MRPSLLSYQMRPSLLATLLVLSFILCEAQGIRVGKVSSSTGHQEIQEEDSALMKRNEEAIDCKDGNCKGRNRKLLTKNDATSTTTTTTSTTTTSKNHKKEENKAGSKLEGKSSSKEEIFTVNSSPVSGATPEGYPDILDIAGMDYTPAKRKPPIHN